MVPWYLKRQVLLESFESKREKINFVVRSTSNNICGGNNENETSSYLSPHLNDPLQVRAKGCGKRLKRRKEKAMNKSRRHCHGCGQT